MVTIQLRQWLLFRGEAGTATLIDAIKLLTEIVNTTYDYNFNRSKLNSFNNWNKNTLDLTLSWRYILRLYGNIFLLSCGGSKIHFVCVINVT